MTLEQFMSGRTPNRLHLRDPDFKVMYCRRSRRLVWVDEEVYDFPDLFQIARVEAARPGTGAFTRLFERYRDQPIFIESLMEPEGRFRVLLDRLGFQRANPQHGSIDYLWLPLDA